MLNARPSPPPALDALAPVLETALDAVIVMGVDGLVLDWNARAESIFGWTRDEALGRELAELVIPERMRAAHRAGLRRALSGGPTHILGRMVETSGLRRDGSEFPVELSITRPGLTQGEVFLGVIRDITQRRSAEKALEESRASLITLVNSVDQMIWTARPDGYHDFFNDRWYDYTGAAPGSTLGEAWALLFHPDDRARIFARWRRSLRSGEPYEIEYRLRRRDGAYRWMLGRAHPVRNEAGEIVRWMGTCTDIHEQKEFGERFRMLHQAHPTAHLVLAPDLTIEEASEPYLRATLARREDIVGKNLFEAFPDNPDDPAATGVRNLRASLERVLRTHAPDRMPVQKYDVRRPTGGFEVRWWAPLNVPVVGPDGEIRHIIHQVEDLTAEMVERQRAAEARAGEARFRAVAETLPGLVFETDPEGLLTYASSHFTSYAGVTGQMLREDWGRIVHPDDRAQAMAAWTEAIRTSSVFETEMRLRRADGAWRWFLTRASPFLDAEGLVKNWVGVCIDVTEQRKAIELQRTLLQEVSHRVKNSLALVSGVLRLQARALEGAARFALDEASQRVHAVARVHDQLWRRASTREIDLGAFLCDLCEAIADSSPRHRTICDAEAAIVSADLAVPFGLLVNELLTNAYKYAYPEGQAGEVRLIGVREPGNRYRLVIEDAGVGLPPGFDPAAARESLGMRVITNITAQLGGALTAGSAEPGARFTLVFPLENDHAPEAAPPRPTRTASGPSLTQRASGPPPM